MTTATRQAARGIARYIRRAIPALEGRVSERRLADEIGEALVAFAIPDEAREELELRRTIKQEALQVVQQETLEERTAVMTERNDLYKEKREFDEATRTTRHDAKLGGAVRVLLEELSEVSKKAPTYIATRRDFYGT